MINKLKCLVITFLMWWDEKIFFHYYPGFCAYISFHPWLECFPYKRVECVRCGQIPVFDYDKLIVMPWRDFLIETLRDAPENDTYKEAARWLARRFTQEQIASMYAKLMGEIRYAEAMVGMRPVKDTVRLDGVDDKFLRDQMDVFWFAVKNKDLIYSRLNLAAFDKPAPKKDIRQLVDRLNNQ